MRLWSLHPELLDRRALVACWRETLLAQAVLKGATKGYRTHPQLQRFRARPQPVGAVAEYLRGIHEESVARGYRFDARKISSERDSGSLTVTRGQLFYEWEHLLAKVAARDEIWSERLADVDQPGAHPLFRVVPGGVEPWEKT